MGLLCEAIQEGNEAEAIKLIEQGYNLDQNDAFDQACAKGYVRVVKTLMNCGVSVHGLSYINPKTPLYLACEGGHKDIVQLLIDNGVNVNLENLYNASPLNIACENGREDVVQLLIDHGANIKWQDEYGSTLLHNVCWSGNINIAKLLIKNGVDVNYRGNYWCAPLELVCQRGHTDIAKLFVENGADINALDDYGDTALHRASVTDRYDTIQFLIDAGIEINVQNKYGQTELLVACGYKSHNAVKFLIAYGVDLDVQNDDGDTALSLALARKLDHDTIKLLVKYGANIRHSSLDAERFIQTLRDYQDRIKAADHTDEYQLAMANAAARNAMHDNRLEATELKDKFANDAPNSQKIHNISENDAIKYINNPFVSPRIKNKLLMNAIKWYEDDRLDCIFNEHLFEQIQDPCGVLNDTLEGIKLGYDICSTPSKQWIKKYEYSMHVHRMIMHHSKAGKIEVLKKLSTFYPVDHTQKIEVTLDYLFTKFVEYAKNFTQEHPEELYMIKDMCARFDNNNYDMFSAVKQFYPELNKFKCLANYMEYDSLIDTIYGVWDDERKASIQSLLKSWYHHHNDNNFDHLRHFYGFLKCGFGLDIHSGTFCDATHFDKDSVECIMAGLLTINNHYYDGFGLAHFA